MAQSENINELALALSKVQASLHGAQKTSENPFFKSSYADLQSVWESCRELLARNNLSIVQAGAPAKDKHIAIRTVLMHSSGQWIDGVTELPMTKADPQQAGSAITYARRYSLAAMVGIYQTDDDANAATHETESERNARESKRALNDAKIELFNAYDKDKELLQKDAQDVFNTDAGNLTIDQIKELTERQEQAKFNQATQGQA